MAEGTPRDYDILLRNGDDALSKFGDTPQGAHWPVERDRLTRFDVMLDVMTAPPQRPMVYCDFACGTGELLAHIRARGIANIEYLGVDRSRLALDYARAKFPGARFIELDVNDPAADLSQLACDYLTINGLFTVKWGFPQEAMWDFMASTLRRLWPHVRRGLGLNVMSKAVDWEREDLFHVPMDDMAKLLHSLAGRHVMIRADYGLYEYTAYAFRENPRLDLVGRSPRS